MSPAEFKKITKLERLVPGKYQVTNLEHRKKWPDRYPNNSDSIGIELDGYYDKINKGKPNEKAIFHSVTEK